MIEYTCNKVKRAQHGLIYFLMQQQTADPNNIKNLFSENTFKKSIIYNTPSE